MLVLMAQEKPLIFSFTRELSVHFVKQSDVGAEGNVRLWTQLSSRAVSDRRGDVFIAARISAVSAYKLMYLEPWNYTQLSINSGADLEDCSCLRGQFDIKICWPGPWRRYFLVSALDLASGRPGLDLERCVFK